MCGPMIFRKFTPTSSTFRQGMQTVRNFTFFLFAIMMLLSNGGDGVLAAQSFVEQPSDTTVMIGEAAVILKCVVREKSGHVMWFYGDVYFASDRDMSISSKTRFSFVGNTSSGEYNLQITNVILQDDGEYHCRVSAGENSDPGIDSRRARLIIQRMPSSTSMQPSNRILTVTVNIKTNLTCQATSANPVAQIKWLRASEDISTTHQRTWSANDPSGKLMNIASVLTLSPAIADNSVVYECRILHMAMPAPHRHSLTLDVLFAPVVVVEASHSMPIREDTLVKFQCIIIKANPRLVSYTWTKNEELLLGAETNQIELTIRKDDHEASIKCTAENRIGSRSGSITTPVLYGPRFLDIPISVSVDEEDPAQMSCSADGNPKPTIKWTRLGSRATLSTMNKLQFDLVRESDVGTYVCIATVPGFEPVRRYGRIDINAIPYISSPTEQKAKIGHKATVECFTDTKPAPYMVTWAWDDLEVEEGSVDRFTATKREVNGGILSSLTIDKFKRSDFGTYNCTMRNNVGNASLLIELTQQDLDPIIWIIIAVIGAAAVVFIMTIIVMIYCRRKWQRRKTASSMNKGKVQLEIIRKLPEGDYDAKSHSDSYDYNATPPSTPGKPRYAEPYQYTRGRSDSFDDTYYQSPRRHSDSYSCDGPYLNNEYSEPIIRKREDDRTSYRSDTSEDYAPRSPSNSRYDDDMYDEEVKHYNTKGPRYEEDSHYDNRSYGSPSHDDNRSYDEYYHGDGYFYSNKGSEVESEVSFPTKNKLATNV